MLDQKVFLQGINYLKANYLNWGFDINNDLMIKVWYKKFSNLDAAIFMQLVEKYTEVNKYPPNSPAELLDVYRDQLAKQELDADEAWVLVKNLYYEHIYFSTIYEKLADKPALLKTVKEFESEIRGTRSGDIYLVNSFKKAYEKNLKSDIEAKTCLMLGTNVLFLK